MNRNLTLLFVALNVICFIALTEVECKKSFGFGNYRSKSSSKRPSTGSSSWFGSNKRPASSSQPSSKPQSSFSSRERWHSASSSYHKPSVPSAPPASGGTNYGWKQAPAAPSASKGTLYGWNTAPKPNYPVGSVSAGSNAGSKTYPVQSGSQQSNYGGFHPAPSLPNSHHVNTGINKPSSSGSSSYHPSSVQNHPSSSNPVGHVPPVGTHGSGYNPSGGYHASAGTPGSGYNPSGGYHPQVATHGSGYNPSGGYHPPVGTHGNGYNPSGAYHPPVGTHGSGYNPSGSYHSASYPQQTFSHYYPSQSSFGYHPSSSFGSSLPTYQGTSLFGGHTGNYGYTGGGNWGIPIYGSQKSSGTGKLVTGLAVGYLASSLVNKISNPWRYSGHGYGSGFDYGSYGSSSAFERGYISGLRDREDKTKTSPAAAPVPQQEEDPTSKWVNCVAFDPQTQQTLINPNCSCTVTTSLDDRTGQPISVHHCTTLNGLVMRPIPVVPKEGVHSSYSESTANQQEPGGVNSPGIVPAYMDLYQNQSQYGSAYGIPSSTTNQSSSTPNIDVRIFDSANVTTQTAVIANSTSDKTQEATTGTVPNSEVKVFPSNVDIAESKAVSGGIQNQATTSTSTLENVKSEAEGLVGAKENEEKVAEFYAMLQKIVNMGNFVDGGENTRSNDTVIPVKTR